MATENEYSVSLDGNDAVSMTDHADLAPTGDFTVGVWMKTSNTNTQIIIANYYFDDPLTTRYGWYLAIDTTGKARFNSAKGTGNVPDTDYKNLTSTGLLIDDGKWHFVVATWDGSDMNIYVDGILDATVAWANAPGYWTTKYPRIGCSHIETGDGTFFDGNIDGAFIVNGTALTQAEIVEMMLQKANTTLLPNLKAYYEFENGLTDTSGSTNTHNGSAIGTPTYDSGADDVPFTYYLESTDNLASVDLELSSSQYAYHADNASLSITGDFTVEAWIKLEQLPTTAESAFTIVSKYRTSATALRSYVVMLYPTDKLDIFYSNDGTNTTRIETDAVIVDSNDVGKWVHIACAVDVSAKSAAIYKNGTLVASSLEAGTQTSIQDNASVFCIGANNEGNSDLFDGKIDDVRLWNDIRTATEIRENMNIIVPSDSANLVSNWLLNTDYTDETSNGNDLTPVNSPIFVPDQAFDVANRHSMDLELSSSEYASITDGNQSGLDLNSDFTIEAWIKLEQLPSTAGTAFEIVSKYGWTGANKRQYTVTIRTSNKMRVYWSNGTVTSYVECDTAFDAGDVGAWNHVAVAVDLSAQTAAFYINGSAQSTTPTPAGATSIANSTDPFVIGAVNASAAVQFFDGQINDVRVWNDIRSEAEIQDNMDVILDGDEANLVSCWRLNNNYADITSNGNHLTPVNTPTFNWIVPYDGGIGFYSKSLTETITITDSLAKFPKRTFLESVSIVEA